MWELKGPYEPLPGPLIPYRGPWARTKSRTLRVPPNYIKTCSKGLKGQDSKRFQASKSYTLWVIAGVEGPLSPYKGHANKGPYRILSKYVQRVEEWEKDYAMLLALTASFPPSEIHELHFHSISELFLKFQTSFEEFCVYIYFQKSRLSMNWIPNSIRYKYLLLKKRSQTCFHEFL